MMDVTQFPAAKCWQRLSFQDEPAQKPRYLTASFLCSIQWLTAELLVSFLFKTNNTAFTNSRNISRIWPFLPDKHLEAIPTTSHRSVAARADLEMKHLIDYYKALRSKLFNRSFTATRPSRSLRSSDVSFLVVYTFIYKQKVTETLQSVILDLRVEIVATISVLSSESVFEKQLFKTCLLNILFAFYFTLFVFYVFGFSRVLFGLCFIRLCSYCKAFYNCKLYK